MKNNATKTSFIDGPIRSPLLKFTVPIILSMTLQCAYGAVDVFIISRFCSNGVIAAVGSASLLIICITNFIMGMSTGMTVAVGNKIGAGNNSEASRCVGSASFLFFFLSVGISALMILLENKICVWMNILPEALDSFIEYNRICAIGMVFIFAYNAVNSVFQSIGDSKTPLKCVGVACIINILGDWCLIGVLEMGAAGAAIATVVAQALSVIFSLYILAKKQTILKINEIKFKYNSSDINEICHLGLPIGLQQSITTIGMIFINSTINSFGLVIASAVSIGMKIVGFISIPIKAHASSLSAFVAQNYGAKRMDRTKETLKIGCQNSFVISGLVLLIVWIFSYQLMGLFTSDSEVIATGADYIRGFGIDNIVGCFTFCFTGYFNGIRKSMYVMFQSIFCALLVRIPCAMLVARYFASSFMFGFISPIASFVGLIIYLIFFFRLLSQEKRA